MNHPSQEDLLGYVLGALDAQEHRNIQRQLDEHPESEDRLLALKASLAPLELLNPVEHRPGLARRTCEWVARCDDAEIARRLNSLDSEKVYDSDDRLHASVTSPAIDSPIAHSNTSAFAPIPATFADSEPPIAEVATANLSDSRWLKDQFNPLLRSWSVSDVLVGVCLLGVFGALLFPAISWSRQHSRLLACQNNLRQVGTAFMLYSSNNHGGFVSIPSEGNLSAAGCYGPILKDAGLLAEDSLLACAGLVSSVPVVIPSCEQVLAASTSTEVNHLQQTMGGHFGHSMGHRKGDRYAAPRNDGQSFVVLLADRPSNDQPGRVSMNHGGSGQNCLFADGRVAYVSGHSYGADALFENDYGVVAPGSNELDNVIAPSHLSPAAAVLMTESTVGQ